MAKPRNRQGDFAGLLDRAPKDLDPENDAVPDEDDEDGSDVEQDEVDEDGAREHYVDVGKSKLRKPKEVNLGTRYRGARIARDAAFEGDSDEGFPEDDAADTGSSDVSMSGDEDEEGDSDGDEDDMDDIDDETGEHTEDTDMSSEEDASIPVPTIDKSELRRAMAADQKAIATSIVAATKSDAEKGRAVKRQRTTYDTFLNTRIKMQKTLIAANSLVALEPAELDTTDSDHATIIEQAETAAYNLWAQLTAYRNELSKAQLSAVSAPPHSLHSEVEGLWMIQRSQDAAVFSNRDAVLQKWSHKSRGVTAPAQQSRLNTEKPATIVDVLNEQLSSTDRLMQRARTPRSSAPVQVARRVQHDERIYDDVDFYGLLLKELLDSKSSSASTAAANVDVKTFINVRREAKTRRNVDTKASKGRKLKYTVHEKLQNFCAPDDRTSWSERQTQELFLSLFGRQMGLREDVSADEESEDDVADAGLMMFRSNAT